MKKVTRTTTFFLLFISFSATAQTSTDSTVLSIAEQMPEYPGGNDSLFKEIMFKVVYPQACVDSNMEGKVYLRFIVNEDGSISDIEAIKSPHPSLSIASIAALKTVGKFLPGRQKGKAVRVWVNVPVNFKINHTREMSEDSQIINKDITDYFVGGATEFERFIKDHIHIPKEADSAGLDAIIFVKCSVSKALKLEPVEIKNSLKKFLDEEAIRLIHLMPPLSDSIAKLQVSKVRFLVPVTFAVTPYDLMNPLFKFTREGGGELKPIENYNEGVNFFNKEEYSNALKAFDSAIKLNPRDGDAFFNRGVTRLKLNRTGACDDFTRAYLLGNMDAMAAIKQTCK